MTQQLHESLSALMDGESNELELRRVLKALDVSPEHADVWRRYHLMRSVMRRERQTVAHLDISANVMAAVEAESQTINDSDLDSVHTAARVRRRRGLSFVGGTAVAAAVSLMVVTGVQFYKGDDQAALPNSASLQANNTVLDNAAQQLATTGTDGSSALQPGIFSQGNTANAASYADFSRFSNESNGLVPVSWRLDDQGSTHGRHYDVRHAEHNLDASRFRFEHGRRL